MRSIFFHFKDTTRAAVAEILCQLSQFGPDRFVYPDKPLDPVLCISFYKDLLTESEPRDLDLIKSALGTLPAVSLMVDISGKVPGDKEVHAFTRLLLGRLPGIVQDEYTPHPWTLPEIQQNTRVEGHGFFDYHGWQQEEKEAERGRIMIIPDAPDALNPEKVGSTLPPPEPEAATFGMKSLSIASGATPNGARPTMTMATIITTPAPPTPKPSSGPGRSKDPKNPLP